MKERRRADNRKNSKPRRESKPVKKENSFRENNFRENKAFDAYERGLQLEGRNAVMEALRSDRPIDKIMVKRGEIEGTLKVIVAMAAEKGIVVQQVDKTKLEYMSGGRNNQGIVALCPAHQYCDVSDILEIARKKNEPPFIIILDEITDPHNLGAIIRTADAAGAHGVIIPKRRAVGLTAIVSKTSAGAIEYVPVARVNNIASTIDELKKQNIWVACVDMNEQTYFEADLKGALAIVIGSEGEGVGRLVKEKCDFSVGIPMYGRISSLNASVSAGLVMYEAVRQRKNY